MHCPKLTITVIQSKLRIVNSEGRMDCVLSVLGLFGQRVIGQRDYWMMKLALFFNGCLRNNRRPSLSLTLFICEKESFSNIFKARCQSALMGQDWNPTCSEKIATIN